MPIEPGEAVLGGETAESRPQDPAVAAGDAVTIVGGAAVPADDTAEFGGVAGESGRTILSGTVLANVNTADANGAVVEGASLTLSPEAGALYREYTVDGTTGEVTYTGSGPATALCDEGGTWHSPEGTFDVPAGYAVVEF